MAELESISTAVIEQIDQALKDDNLETRQGLRFMATVLKNAMKFIDESNQSKGSTSTRLTNVENGLNEFLIAQEKKEKIANEERAKWRWTIIGSVLAVLISQLAQWIFR